MNTTPRMNAAQSSNERYRVGCELERELAAIVPRLNAEWQAKLEAMSKERNVALAKVSKDGRRIAELEAAEERLLKERDALLAEKRALTDMLFAAGMKRDEQTARANDAEAALSAMVHNNARMNGEHIAELRAERARAEKAEAKLKLADAILLEVWGAYNRIGDALKETP